MGEKEGESGLSCLGYRLYVRDYIWCFFFRGYLLIFTRIYGYIRLCTGSGFIFIFVNE